MKSNNKGFSLIELIVAVLIMGIVAGGAIYAFNVVHNARTSSAASVLANVLRQWQLQCSRCRFWYFACNMWAE